MQVSRTLAPNGSQDIVPQVTTGTLVMLLEVGIFLLCKVLSCLKDILNDTSTVVNYWGSMVDTLNSMLHQLNHVVNKMKTMDDNS